jgi:hypothetical protein
MSAFGITTGQEAAQAGFEQNEAKSATTVEAQLFDDPFSSHSVPFSSGSVPSQNNSGVSPSLGGSSPFTPASTVSGGDEDDFTQEELMLMQ